jgi:hypothetical protein
MVRDFGHLWPLGQANFSLSPGIGRSKQALLGCSHGKAAHNNRAFSATNTST